MDMPEISDLLVAYDPDTLERKPTYKRELVEQFLSRGNRSAAAVVSKLPEVGGELDRAHVDALLLRAHCELQRLSEEFQQGRRVERLLRPLVSCLRAAGVALPIRVVDVGCGLGYVLRWLALHGELGADVELVGVDYNRVLIDAATRAARADRAPCRFLVGNAFTLREPAAIFISTGVVHHFRDQELLAFFRGQSGDSTLGFLHFDIKPTWLSPLGAWIFHQARMREPLSRHDGVLSARRAHTGGVLLSAARDSTAGFRLGLFDGAHAAFPILHVLQALVGVRNEHWGGFRSALGSTAARLQETSAR